MVCREKTVCFTGHRTLLADDTQLYARVYHVTEHLILQGFLYFGVGGARGFDLMASEAVLQLKHKYPQIHLILVLPFADHYHVESGWSPKEIKVYESLEQGASKIVYVQKNYASGCYYKRNRHLVDFSSVCVCYQYKPTGGTAYTTKYAAAQGLTILNCADPLLPRIYGGQDALYI